MYSVSPLPRFFVNNLSIEQAFVKKEVRLHARTMSM